MYYGLTGIHIRMAAPRYDIASLVEVRYDDWSDASSWPDPEPIHDLDNRNANRAAYPNDW